MLISCPVPSCSHPAVKPDQCCPTCEGMSHNSKGTLFIRSSTGQLQVYVDLCNIILLSVLLLIITLTEQVREVIRKIRVRSHTHPPGTR